jgi:dipeptidase
MGSDMVVALSRATVDGQTFFGHNSNRPTSEGQAVLRQAGRVFAPGETLQLQHLLIPQAPQTLTVLASRSRGALGYHNGVNEKGLAVARTSLRTRLDGEQKGLTGAELVRLLLERATSARLAVDLAIELIGRHGQARDDKEAEPDSAFLIADGAEAFVLVIFGSWWLEQEVADWRAVSEVCQLHQNWGRIAPGLADHVIQRGWWPNDGSKFDFEQALGNDLQNTGEGCGERIRRKGRATAMLEQQHGRLDLCCLRHLLSDHSESVGAAEQGREPDPWSAPEAMSLLACLNPQPARTAWYAFGPPCVSVYFPFFFEGDIPAAFGWERSAELSVCEQLRRLTQRAGSDRGRWLNLREALGALQARFEQETREFQEEVKELIEQGQRTEVGRQAGAFMQHNLECFEDLCRSLLHDARQPPRRASLARDQERFSQMTEL